MASVSSTNTSFLPSWPSESNSNTLRDVSFSSYLNSSEETYIRSLVESSQTLKKNKVEDGEIDVFTADKYFNGEETQDKLDTIMSTERKHVHHKQHQEVVNQPQTPSNQSESSSWNSQSALLKRVPRIPSWGNNSNSNTNSQNKSKIQGKRLFLPCCSCSDKTSADVEEELIKNQTKRDVSLSLRSIKTNLETSEITRLNKLRLQRETSDPFFFPQPVSDSPVTGRSLITGVKNVPINEQPDEQKRKSLDVFGSNDMDEHGILGRRLNMLSWDAIPRVQTEDVISNASASGPPSESFKDTESDASSDLFEIECLLCNANPVGVGLRRPSDGSTTPTTCYAPSEASIEWSVVTASAADFSAFSDSEDHRSGITSVNKRRNPPKLSPSSKMPGMLLGCKSQKAVRVAGDVYRTPIREKLERERKPRNSDLVIAMTRFQAEAKLGGFGQKPRKEVTVVSPRPPKWSLSLPSSDPLQF